MQKTETLRSKRDGNDGEILVQSNSEILKNFEKHTERNTREKWQLKFNFSRMHSYVWPVVETDVGAK